MVSLNLMDKCFLESKFLLTLGPSFLGMSAAFAKPVSEILLSALIKSCLSASAIAWRSCFSSRSISCLSLILGDSLRVLPSVHLTEVIQKLELRKYFPLGLQVNTAPQYSVPVSWYLNSTNIFKFFLNICEFPAFRGCLVLILTISVRLFCEV